MIRNCFRPGKPAFHRTKRHWESSHPAKVAFHRIKRYQVNQNQENSVGPKSYLKMMQVLF